MTARRLVPRMGVDVLIDAIATLRTNGRAIRLVVIGDGELRRALTRYRDHHGLGRVVQFLGRVPDEELVDWYRAADVFVLPTTAYEGYGMVTAEALACATPVVATNVGASPEILTPSIRASSLTAQIQNP